MSDSRITPAHLYRAVLLAFFLVVAGLVFEQLLTLVLAVLIVVIIALPIGAFASFLMRLHVPRALGAVLGLLLGLAAIGGLVAAIVPVFSHEINQFVNSLPSIIDDLRHRLGRLTGTSPSKIGQQVQSYVNGYTHHPTRLLGPLASVGASVAAVAATLVGARVLAITPSGLRPNSVCTCFTAATRSGE